MSRPRPTRDRLSELGFEGDAQSFAPGSIDTERRLRALDQDGLHLADGIRLFRLGHSVPVERVRAALGQAALEELSGHGLLVEDAGTIAATCRLTWWRDLLLAHDPDEAPSIGANTVLGVNPTTRLLATLTNRTAVRRALDIGTGCGSLALAAAGHAEEVVAADILDRCLNYTAVNAALNGVDNVVPVQGSLFEPVGDEPFDLIFGNLPFVLSPDTTYAWRDAGARGDELARLTVREAAGRLTPGGTAQFLCNWAIEAGGTWDDHPRAWLDGLDCDAWIVHRADESSLDYSRLWNAPMLADRPDDYLETVERWVDYHRQEGIAQLAYGAVLLRSGSGSAIRRFDEMAVVPTGSGGDQMVRMFANNDRLADATPLADRVLGLLVPHRIEQLLHYDEGGYRGADARLVAGDTVGVVGPLSALASNVVLRLDGLRTVGEICRDAADETGLPLGDLVADAEAALTELVARGLVEVVDA